MNDYFNKENFKETKHTKELSELLESIVEFGARMVGWSLNLGLSFKETLPLLPMLHKSIETTDAASILIKNRVQDSLVVLLRVIIENCFYAKYILDDNHEVRAKAFVYCHFREQIKIHKKFITNSPQSNGLRQKLTKDEISELFGFTNQFSEEHIKGLVKFYESYLEQETFIDIHNRIEKKEEWYSIDDGPKNIEMLAKKIGLSLWYQVYYRHFSGSIHHHNLLDEAFILKTNSPELNLPSIRSYDKQINTYTKLFVLVNLELYQSYLEHFLPNKISEYFIWYSTIRDRYLAL